MESLDKNTQGLKEERILAPAPDSSSMDTQIGALCQRLQMVLVQAAGQTYVWLLFFS